MNSLMIFGVMCWVLSISVFCIAISNTVKNSKSDDDRFKESLTNLCLGIIIGATLICGALIMNIGKEIEEKIYEEHLETNDGFSNEFERYDRYDRQD